MVDMKMMRKILIVISIVIILSMAVSCESFKRGMKTFKSDFGGGIDRRIELYDYTGNLIKVYEGKFDIQTSNNDNKVLFDLNGKRTIIHGGIVVIDEI